MDQLDPAQLAWCHAGQQMGCCGILESAIWPLPVQILQSITKESRCHITRIGDCAQLIMQVEGVATDSLPVEAL